jgi:hypothetical protein
MNQPVEIEKVRGGATGAVSSITKRWSYRVTDIATLAKARPDLVVDNSSMIRKQISAGIREIPGLEIFQEEHLAIR